ncbi:MAG: ferrous iron transport protein B [Candidatus Pacebacteria bacterium]|nr:ferrous iron transport protein B [Candidatus Paceibacterota bacterium]
MSEERQSGGKTGRGRIRVALAGNPNSGKTTIFNALTGARQHVGNYPGVTVERKEGRFCHGDRTVDVVDLPGTYSLTAYSPEEVVARDVIIEESPDLVVHVIDASNLERNLYLATQLAELSVPLVLVFNMTDVAQARGYEIDIAHLSELLRVPIVQTVGHRREGMEELKQTILDVANDPAGAKPATVHYGADIERELAKIVKLLKSDGGCPSVPGLRWLATKLLENDEVVREELKKQLGDPARVFSQVDASRQHLEREIGDDPEVLIADHRYGYISGACQEAVRSTVESRHTISDRIDFVVTNRVLGLPIFLLMMYLVFKLTFTLAEAPMGWTEALFAWMSKTVAGFWPAGSESALQSMLVDGVIGGVGGVLVFLPVIVLLFLAIAILEDSGYMARAAFLMDRVMHKIGLHGKSFIPMLLGFGCTVPAIMATRTLENRRDRLTTMLVLPLISCGARLPIYALFIPAFFPKRAQAPLLWGIYLIGIVLAVLLAKLLRSTLFRGETAPFVMELPPYRMPTIRSTLTHMWERAWLFLRKAGTVIVAFSVLLWVLTSYPKAPEENVRGLDPQQAASTELSYSVAGRIGHGLEPVMENVGFDWKTTTAMIGAFAAKEIFVAQLGIVHAIGEVDEESLPLREVLRREYTPLQAFCIMLFCLISVPCMVTIATTWRESGSWKWPALQLVGLTVLAYVVTFAVYQIGMLL